MVNILVAREMQAKILQDTIELCSLEKQYSKRQTISSVGKDVGKMKPSFTSGRNIK
jgi:hypothetical protein